MSAHSLVCVCVWHVHLNTHLLVPCPAKPQTGGEHSLHVLRASQLEPVTLKPHRPKTVGNGLIHTH